MSPRLRSLRVFAASSMLALGACASVTFERTTETSGTFVSSGIAVTIFSIDIPKPAVQIARENASDSNLANMQVDEVRVTPDFGIWNRLLDVISVRRAVIKGRWGYEGED